MQEPIAMSNAAAPIATINVTPLVDVMLVLLIIFMITAPAATHRLRVNLPHLEKNPPPPAEPLRLRIAADGALFLDGAAIRRDVLLAEAAFQSAQGAQRGIEIDAADTVAYAHVADVLGTFKNAGLNRVSFAPHKE
jgi:biopolymer transport protein ExbD